MRSNVLTRIRLPLELVTRIDMLGADVRAIVKRRVARAKMIRALIKLGLDTALTPELASAVKADTIRQGREKARLA